MPNEPQIYQILNDRPINRLIVYFVCLSHTRLFDNDDICVSPHVELSTNRTFLIRTHRRRYDLHFGLVQKLFQCKRATWFEFLKIFNGFSITEIAGIQTTEVCSGSFWFMNDEFLFSSENFQAFSSNESQSLKRLYEEKCPHCPMRAK